jgi:hypothetical protein
MANFVRGLRFSDGYVNLDLVSVVKPRPKDEHGRSFGWDCWDANQDPLPSVAMLDDPRTIIPNQHLNLRVIIFWSDELYNRLPILAWKIDDSVAIPLTFETLDDCSAWCIEYPGLDGPVFQFPDGEPLLEMETAIEHVKALIDAKRMQGER